MPVPLSQSSFSGATSLAVSWENLTYSVGSKQILKGLSGQALPSRTLAVMGSSGAGKTTFLNALCDRLVQDKQCVLGGRRSLNEITYDRKYRKLIGFVTQDDVVSSMATPADALSFSLRIRRGTDPETTRQRVDEMIDELNLRNARDTIVGIPGLVVGLSGGERKRTNIGVELIADTKVLLLDEPTSGLDSYTAVKIISLVKDLAARGRTVIFSIHQPTADCVELFDDLLLLCQGKTVYHGTMANAVGYFEGLGYVCPTFSTPTDYFMTLMQDETTGAKLVLEWDRFLEAAVAPTPHTSPKPNLRQNITEEQEGRAPYPEENNSTQHFLDEYVKKHGSPLSIQASELMKRSVTNVLRNKVYILMVFVQALVFSILVGLIFINLKHDVQSIQDRIGLLFMVIANRSFNGAMMMINTFPKEKAVFIREQQAGAYSPLIYFLAKTFSELPVHLAATALETIMIYFITGLVVDAGRFFVYYAVVNCVFQASAGLGLVLSASIDSYVAASGLAPLTIVPMMLAGGLLGSTDQIRPYWYWLEKISLVRYGFVLLVQNEFEGVQPFTCDPNYFDVANGTAFCANQPKTGLDVLNLYELNGSGQHKWELWLSLGLWIVLMRVICVFALNRVAKRTG